MSRRIVLGGLVAGLTFATAGAFASAPRLAETYQKLPLHFEPNRGQSDAQVRFLARGPGYGLFLTDHESVLALRGDAGADVVTMKLMGAKRAPVSEGLDPLPGRSHYFAGNDPAGWVREVPQYAKVRYREVYSGIDLLYYGNGGQLEHDFVVAPGADPRKIRLSIGGAGTARLDDRGNLVIKAAGGEVTQLAPVIYQEIAGERKAVAGRYRLDVKGREVRFDVSAYDRRRPLVIDPVLVYSTYLGGGAYDFGSSIAVDSSGSVYVAGQTYSTDFPTATPIQGAHAGYGDVFVTKLNPAGSAIVYSTYLGGGDYDFGYGIAVDASGSAYVAGATASLNFPTANPLQATLGASSSSDGFVTKLNATGSALVYSTYLGGIDYDVARAIAVDSLGNAYVAGHTRSVDFPVANPFQGSLGGPADAFVTKINPAGSALVYSTYLGGDSYEDPDGSTLAVDASGSAYVTGFTYSSDFPTVNPVQGNRAGDADAFVTKLNASGSALVYSTFLGGTASDSGTAIAVDASGSAYVTGDTKSPTFPTRNPFQPAHDPSSPTDAFVTKLNPAGSALAYSTYLGGSREDRASSIAVDGLGSAYVTGQTGSPNFPLANAVQERGGGEQAFITKLTAAGSGLVYSTYLGGGFADGRDIAVDASGTAYLTGETTSVDFPTVNAIQTSRRGREAFVVKLGDFAGPALSIGSATVTEGDSGATDAVFTVSLSAPSSQTVTVHYVTDAGTALIGYDLAPVSGTLTFAPGITAQTVAVPVVGDTSIETDETFFIRLKNASAPMARVVGVGTIQNDDVPGVAITDVTAAEGSARNAVFRVTVSPALDQTVTVSYTTQDGTAIAGGDYTTTTGTLTFTPGRTIHSIFVPIVTDTVAEGPETFTVTLSNPVNVALARATATGTIGDPPPLLRVPMYRAYNPDAFYHFFTTSKPEFDAAVANGYRDETTGNGTFFVLNTELPRSLPLFRMYNPSSGTHYYTLSPGERDTLQGLGWVYERDEGFVYPAPEPETVVVFRLYNNISGTHLFTADEAMKDSILATFPGIWFEHAPLGYAFASP